MWYSVFNRETGRLYSVGSVCSPIVPPELDLLVTDEEPRISDWDSDTRTYIDRSAKESPAGDEQAPSAEDTVPAGDGITDDTEAISGNRFNDSRPIERSSRR